MSFLDELLASTRRRIDETKAKISEAVLEQRVASAPAPGDFARALHGDGISVIAEIKRATPLKGPLNLDLNAAETASAYADGGAAAISVLTEPDSFLGSLEDLEAARAAGLPVLRKDFIVDAFQVIESRAWGADAVLLIVRALGDELAELKRAIEALGMQALIEVHDDADLERALALDARLIGINHRDLETFEIDTQRTAKLIGMVPEQVTVVALSGVAERAELLELESAGAHAVLIGEALVCAPDPAGKLRHLLGRE